MSLSSNISLRVISALRQLKRGLLRRGESRLVILPEISTPPVGSAPIFIVGCPRSGTSLVRRILDAHSRIACPPESFFLIPLLSLLEDTMGMRGLEGMGFKRPQVLERVRRFASGFHEDYARATGKARWADKTPFYIDILESIDEVFEARPRYIFVHRNGLDVSYSMIHALPRWMKSMPNLSRTENPSAEEMAAAYWRDQVMRGEAFRKNHPERCLAIRYESLCTAPAEVVRSLCSFVGEEFEASMIKHENFFHVDGIEDGRIGLTKGIEPSIGKYRSWGPEKLASVSREAEPMLTALGYSL